MPPTIDNPTDRAREEGDDADWANWEQMFRDAKPVLPEAAMARIEASIRREAERAAPPKKSRIKFWIILIVVLLLSINGGVVWLLMNAQKENNNTPESQRPTGGQTVQHRFAMDVMIGPPLVAPDRPILPLAQYAELLGYEPKEPPKASVPISDPALVHAAEKVVDSSLDGWHQLGLLEIRRAAGISAPLAVPFPPHDDEFRIVADWRMLPLDDKNLIPFRDQLRRLSDGFSSPDAQYWPGVYAAMLSQHDKAANSDFRAIGGNSPTQFPSKLGDRARLDLLVELGETKAQAALDVLSTRSYAGLKALRDFETANARGTRTPTDYQAISHDLVERVVALRLLNENNEAHVVLQNAIQLRYLNDPQDLAVLLARLGPVDAWEKLLRPLMEDESTFVQHPPTFDQSAQRSASDAVVVAGSELVKDGITTYLGPGLILSAGPWRITCDKLTAFHNADHGMLLSGSGNVRFTGVIGLFSATATDMTLNTDTGDLKLSGHIYLEPWNAEASNPSSCTITRTGEVKAGI